MKDNAKKLFSKVIKELRKKREGLRVEEGRVYRDALHLKVDNFTRAKRW